MDNSTYLLRNTYGIFHFCMVVPRRFRSALQLREVKRSLNTRSHIQALHMARRYSEFLVEKTPWGNHFGARGYCVDTVGLDKKKIWKFVKYQEQEEKKQEKR